MKKIVVLLVALATINGCSKDESTQNATKTSVHPPTNSTAPVQEKTSQAPTNGLNSYTPQEAQQFISQRKDLLIVDVRSPQELREGKLANSTLVPFWNIMKGQHQLPRNRPLLLVCAVGGRSYAAMQILARQGYSELYNLSGGVAAWKKAKLPLVY